MSMYARSMESQATDFLYTNGKLEFRWSDKHCGYVPILEQLFRGETCSRVAMFTGHYTNLSIYGYPDPSTHNYLDTGMSFLGK